MLMIRNLSKTFPGTRALDSAHLELRAGEVHALVGQNGSGKSTMIKILAGFHQPDPGAKIILNGQEVAISDTAASRELGFRFVHQDLGLVPTLDTVENLALGEGYRTGRAGRIRWRTARREARERMWALGYGFDVRRPVSQLAAAERTGIAIARALHNWEQARVLVVDEPTASLPSDEVSVLFEALSRVRAKGLGVIYISHRLDEIFQIGDRVTPLRDGRVVGTFPIAELDEEKLIAMMCGDVDLSPHVVGGARRISSDPVLEARAVCGEVVAGVDFAAYRGEVLGIAGLTGSGREELLRLLFGALPRSGEVLVSGKPIRANLPNAAMDARVALVPADRTGSGSVLEMTVRENLTLTDVKRHSKIGGRLSKTEERRETRQWIDSLEITPPRADAPFGSLSGGNQQKVVLAKWLRTNPVVLLLDEPTQGVDVHAKATIHALARNAAADGSTVVIASSDEVELCDTCDRILVMRDGEFRAELAGDSMTPETIGTMQLGGAAAQG